MTNDIVRDTYALGRSEAETQRLIRQGQQQERQLRRFLEDAGLVSGMKVLDVGSGAGDVALTAARIVGHNGSVVGVEMNPVILETARARVSEAGLGNVRFAVGDLREDIAVESDFDAIIGRYVLCYVAEPAAALERLVGHLKQGGIAAFQEFDCRVPATTFPHSDLQGRIWEWMLKGQLVNGTDQFLGLKLYELFVEAGLSPPEMRGEVTITTPSRPAAVLAQSFLPAVGPKLIEAGIVSREEFDLVARQQELDEERAREGTIAMFYPTVLAWARKL